MRPVVIAALTLCGCAIVLGLTLGQKAAKLSETDVIEHFAAKFVRETGGQRTECHAVPSPSSGVWMIVQCGTGDGKRQYYVDTYGNQIAAPLLLPEA